MLQIAPVKGAKGRNVSSDLEKKIEQLAQTDLLGHFGADALRILAFGADTRALAKGAKLYGKGTLAQSGYFLASGKMELKSAGGATVAEAGAMLNELGMICEVEHGADATALSDCEVIEIPRNLLLRILREYPADAEPLIKHIRAKTGAFFKRLDSLAASLDYAGEAYRRSLDERDERDGQS